MSEQAGEAASGTTKSRRTRKPKVNGHAEPGVEHPDPLEDLLARVKVNVEDAYSPETVRLLATVKQTNVGAYLKFCADLKQANRLFGKSELDALVHQVTATAIDFGAAESASEILLRLA